MSAGRLYGGDSFERLELSPEISKTVAGCLRRGRNGDGAEVVMNVISATGSHEVPIGPDDRDHIAELVEIGSPEAICLTLNGIITRSVGVERHLTGY